MSAFNPNEMNFDEIVDLTNEIAMLNPHEALLGSFIYKIGPTTSLTLCKMRLVDCKPGNLIYKFIQSDLFLKHSKTQEPLSFENVKKCKWITENISNPIGFTTKQECLETMLELRDWTIIDQELTLDEMAELNGFGFDDAMKCRWMRKQQQSSQGEWKTQSRNCLIFNINVQHLEQDL